MVKDPSSRDDATTPAVVARRDEGEELPLPPSTGLDGHDAVDVGDDDLSLAESTEDEAGRDLDVGDDEVIEDGPEPAGRGEGVGDDADDEPDFEERGGTRPSSPERELEVGLDDGIAEAPRAPDDGGREGPDDDVPIDEAALPPLDAGEHDLHGEERDEPTSHWVFDVSGPHEGDPTPAASEAPPPTDRAPSPPGDLVAWARTASSWIALRVDRGIPHVDRLRGDDGAWERTPLHVSFPASALRSARLVANGAGALALLAGGVVAVARHPRGAPRPLPLEGALAITFLGEESSAPLAVATRTDAGIAVELFDERGDATRVFDSKVAEGAVRLAWDRDRDTLIVSTPGGAFELRRRLAH